MRRRPEAAYAHRPYEVRGPGEVALGYFATAVEAAVAYAKHVDGVAQDERVGVALEAPHRVLEGLAFLGARPLLIHEDRRAAQALNRRHEAAARARRRLHEDARQ